MKIEYHTKKKKCPVVNFTSVHQIWSNLVDKWLWKWANNSFQSAKFTNVQFVGVLLKPFTVWYQHENWQTLSSCHTDYEKCMKPVWKSKMVKKIQDGRHEIQFFVSYCTELFAHFRNHLSTNFDHIWLTGVKSTSGHFFFFVWYSIFNILGDIQKQLIFAHF